MKHNAKRLLSLLLALAMVLSLVPVLAVSAAAEYDIEILCPDKYTRTQPGYKYGEVIKTSYFSTTCNRTKNVNIQLPANYDESKSYPVLYLLHGVMGSENDMLNYGTTIQNMVADGIAEEMIIVYPNMFSSATMSNPSGFNEATMEGYDNFVNDLVNDLMPFVKETCSVKEGKENTAVAGFSMGGREALTVGLFRPDLFGYIGGFAPAPGIVPAKDSYMTHPGTFTEDEVKYEDEAPYMIMICSGDRDSVVGTFPKSYHELYTKNGIEHEWWEIPGSDHGDPATVSGVYNFCKYAFKEQSEAHEHEYESVVTDSTCTQKGYTTYTCSICGRSYTGDETAALGHDYQDGACTRCGKLQPVPGSLANVDFTDPASEDQFEIINQASTAIREGQGLYLITTTDAFEPCNDQISTFNPKDVVKVPVEGDWEATLKFHFSTGSAANGYYQFFGFYAAEGDDYQNLAGIRGGDLAMQNFLRVDGTITADSADLNSSPGLDTNGTYWWRIVKEDTTYTCYRSSNGTSYTEMFSYADTGIEADSLIIDAYTGMTAGYEFMVESVRFDGGEGDTGIPEPDPTGDLPENLSVEPSETNNIPAAIDLYQTSSNAGGWPNWSGSAASAYDLYLPGNTDVANCFFSWEGGLNATMDGKSYASGELPVPAVGETKTITFNNGTVKAFEVTTYQGSESIKAIFIEIDESQGTIAEMNASKDNSCTGIIFLDGEEHEIDKMKGRGNATWSQAVEKRPYNITLGKKVESALGIEMPEKSKKFSILANAADRSLLRNKVGFDIAYEMGIGLDSVSVDLWMNGVYYGVYQFMAKNDAFNTDDGYTVENDNYKEPPISEGGDPSFELEGLNTLNKPNLADYEHNRISVKAIGDNLLPNGDTDEELARVAGEIQAWMQEMWDAIRSEDGYNDQGKYYTEYIDVTSWAKMYLMQEFVKNFDANAGSLKFYREATGEDDKMFAGPLWDLDNALGSTQINSLLGNQVDQTDANGWFMSKLSNDKTSIYKTIGQHEDFMEEVYRVYDNYKHLFDAASTQVVELAEEMEASAAMNFKRITRENYNTVNYGHETVKSAGTAYEQVYKATNSWQDYVDNLETFTRVRAKFLSDNMPAPPECEHEFEAIVTDPTCTEGGFTTYICELCGNFYVTEETEATGHKWDEGVVTKAPTVEAEGEKTFTCTVCKETKTEVIEKLEGHVCPAKDFIDIPAEDHWAHAGIDYAVANELMNGVGDNKFNPGGTLTRAQLVTILYRVEKTPAVEYKATFEDVADNIWYTDAIEWAAANEIVNGVGDGTNFAPDAVITREQIATILYRYEKFKGGDVSVGEDTNILSYPDAEDISSFAVEAMQYAVGAGLITGASVNDVTYLKPLDSATREQIASIMMRYLEAE